MSDYITLLGAEDVRSAGSSMRSAAEQMERAASSMSESVRQMGILLEAHAQELRNILGEKVEG